MRLRSFECAMKPVFGHVRSNPHAKKGLWSYHSGGLLVVKLAVRLILFPL